MPEFIEKRIHNLIILIVEYTPKVIIALVVLFLGLWLINRVAKVADKAMVKRELEISLRTFLKSLISIGLKIILTVTVAGMLGIGTASFVTILGAAGLAIGLALQGSLSNFAGGVLILIFKPFKVGDVIEAQQQTGEVKEIQIFNTLLLTADHKTVIIPNGLLSNGTIINITRFGNLRVDVAITISCENDIKKVKQIISNILIGSAKVLQNPEPGIFVGKVHDGALSINIKPYCTPDNSISLISELYQDLKEAFETEGIKPPMPERRVLNVTDGFND
jgi:small conductance mechanosensitive channel